MTNKLFTLDKNGVEHEITMTSHVAELQPTFEYPTKERLVQALKGLQTVSLECEVHLSPEFCAALWEKNQKLQTIRSAMFKLRKSCRNCRWMKIEKDSREFKRCMHWYCKFIRQNFDFHIERLPLTCEHFRRKSKSKQ